MTVTTTILCLLLDITAAYAYSRFRFKGKSVFDLYNNIEYDIDYNKLILDIKPLDRCILKIKKS